MSENEEKTNEEKEPQKYNLNEVIKEKPKTYPRPDDEEKVE